jgi:cell division protein FtsL
MKGTKMETIHEETPTTETHESEEVKPLTNEEKVLLAKALGTVIVVTSAAVYGATVAGYQAGRFVMRKIQEYHAKKKEESTN